MDHLLAPSLGANVPFILADLTQHILIQLKQVRVTSKRPQGLCSNFRNTHTANCCFFFYKQGDGSEAEDEGKSKRETELDG